MALTPAAPGDAPSASLGRQLVLATLAFCLLFALATVALRTWSAWQNQRAAMTAELELIDQVFRRSLAKAIWEMDREALETHLASAVQAASVGRVRLTVRQAGRTAQTIDRFRPGWEASPRVPELQITLTYEPYAGASEEVGELSLEGDERVLWERLRGEVGSIVLTQLIQSVLLAGLIMWMFNRSVTVHVQQVAAHLGALRPETLDRPLKLVRRSGRRDELTLLESGVNGLQTSLQDYLQRQHGYERELAQHRDHLAELVRERTAELEASQQSLQEMNARLEALSRSDPLTGLPNRRHFDEVKDVEFRRARRAGSALSVLLCDVDYFKRYNDTYGHAKGDECLRGVAQALQATVRRAGDLVARVGGEEFAVLLPATDTATALALADRLRESVAGLGLLHSGSDIAPHVTLSIGVATLAAGSADSFDGLLQRADRALYRAKSRGRDRVAA